jgi:hypothetical protein
LPSQHVNFLPFRSVQSFIRNHYRSASRTTRLTTVTAAAALAAVAAGMSAGPAAAATGSLASASNSAGIVLAAYQTAAVHHTGNSDLDSAATALPFGGAAAPTGQSPLAKSATAGPSAPLGQSAPTGPLARLTPHQAPTQTSGHPAALATAPGTHGATAAQPTTATSQAATPPAAPQPAPAPAPPPQPFQIYDSVTPSAIPANQPVVATYATGGYAVPASVVAGRARVIWIDTRGTDPGAQALDVEPGDATPAIAASWASQRLTEYPNRVAHIYTMISEWPAVKAAIATLPAQMQSHVEYWIADPTGVPHIVPGSMATQWYWGTNYDISTALPGF